MQRRSCWQFCCCLDAAPIARRSATESRRSPDNSGRHPAGATARGALWDSSRLRIRADNLQQPTRMVDGSWENPADRPKPHAAPRDQPGIGIVHGFVPARNLTAVSGHLSIRIRSTNPAFAKTKPTYAAPTRAEASSPRPLPAPHRRAIGWRVIAICATGRGSGAWTSAGRG